MGAVYKKELRGYFSSPIGFVFIAVVFFLSGVFFLSSNILAGTADMRGFFSQYQEIVIFVIPMLTMRTWSDEKRNKTDQALLTAPVGLTRITLGKFFAALTVYGIAASVTVVYALTLATAADVDGLVVASNVFGMMLVGAAMVAKRYLQQSKKPGTICFLGCPAEETGFGKAFLAREGCFADLDAALTWHPSNANKAAAVKTVAYYKVRFDFTGRTAHAGACPELGRSALDACELMNVGVNYLREHIISQARVHYAYLDCGGSAPNVVQEKGSLLYFVRAPKLTQCAEILERIKKIAQGAALMTETQVKISVSGGLSDMIPNQTLAEVF